MKKHALLFVLILVIGRAIFGQYSQTSTSDFNSNNNFNISTANDELKLTNDVGTGADGDLYVSPGATVKVDGVKTYVVGENPSGQNALQVYSSLNFNVGDEVLVITVQDESTDFNSNIAGQYEFKRILSKLATALIFTENLTNTYDTTGKKSQVIKVPNYNTFYIDYGGTVTCDDWNGSTGGIICFKVKSLLQINSLGKIEASKKGFRGGPSVSGSSSHGYQGESMLKIGISGTTDANGNGGGAGLKADWYPGSGANAGGGGGGSYGTPGTEGVNGGWSPGGTPGLVVGNQFLSKLILGGAGGSGAYTNDSGSGISGRGGDGGGIIYISCDTMSIQGYIYCDGESGINASNEGPVGGGGAGSGGTIYIISSKNVDVGNNFITALGQTGGSGVNGGYGGGGAGGNGGDGRIRVDAPVMTGNTLPAIGYMGTNYANSGYSITPVYIRQPEECWSAIIYNKNTTSPGTSVVVDVLNAAGSVLVPNISSGSLINVSNDSIRIKISLSATYANQTPLFYDWMVTTSTAPPAEIIPSGPTQFCEGGSVILNANTGTGFTYQWYRSGTLIGGATGSSYNATQSGIYKVVVTKDCSATSNPVNVVVYPLPSAFAGNDLSVCAGQSVTLTATGGVSYVWNNGVTQGVPFTPQATSVYTVIVTDINGCTATDDIMIAVNPVPPVPFITLNGNVLMSDAPYGNQWYRDGVLIPGATYQTYEHAGIGTYFDIVTLNGCISDTSNVIINTWISENGTAPAFNVYPNPSSNNLSIESLSISGLKEWKVTVISVEGTLLKKTALKTKISLINISDLPRGIYFLKFENEESVLYQKFIKN